MKRQRKEVVSATKSNGISISMPYWDERFAAISGEYPQVKTSQYHIDILTAHLVRNPQWFDVIVGSNLFGDILSDLGPATTGTIAIAPGANINPEKEFPSMFEPVHGSAPDIAGKGISNPIGQIWSGAMMLDHLGHKDAADAIVTAIEKLFTQTDVRTRDMGGTAMCKELGDAIVELVKAG
jgi:tartrate dehydrogenase/decarboxylase/D-malate dehydrogenase